MRIGIVADIHDAVEPLRCALEHFAGMGVEQVVSLGDAFDSYERGDPGAEVAKLLNDAGAVGVWGNHDFGLSFDLTDAVSATAAPTLLELAAGFCAHLVLGDCRFSHIEPWRDSYSIVDLWTHLDVPNTPERARRSFTAAPERIFFIGHYHSWFALREQGSVDWDGSSPLEINKASRYLIGVAAVVGGWSAVFDTEDSVLTPVSCGLKRGNDRADRL